MNEATYTIGLVKYHRVKAYQVTFALKNTTEHLGYFSTRILANEVVLDHMKMTQDPNFDYFGDES